METEGAVFFDGAFVAYVKERGVVFVQDAKMRRTFHEAPNRRIAKGAVSGVIVLAFLPFEKCVVEFSQRFWRIQFQQRFKEAAAAAQEQAFDLPLGGSVPNLGVTHLHP